jgi:hypothetical protein
LRAARCSQYRAGVVHWGFEQLGLGHPGLGGFDQSAHDGSDVALGGEVALGQSLYKGRRGLVCHEPLRQAQADALRGSRVPRQHADGGLAFGRAAALKALAQQRLAAVVVQARRKAEAAGALRVHRPAREDAGQLAHIVLAVAAIDTQGVQFHQLTGVVFVESTAAAVGVGGVGSDGGAFGYALRLVQVEQHGRMASAGQQQVFKPAQCMGANGVEHVVAHVGPHRALACKHIEVVEPELGHAGQQRVLDIRAAAGGQAPGGGLASHLAAEPCFVLTLAAHLAFAPEFFKQGGERLVKRSQLRRHAWCSAAGGRGHLQLLQGPCLALHAICLQARWTVTKARDGPPVFGGGVGHGLCHRCARRAGKLHCS